MIRMAENADITQIAEIFRQLHKKHYHMRPEYYNMPDIAYFEKSVAEMLEDKEKYLVVCDEGGKICGYAWYYIDEVRENELRKACRRCFAEQLAVDESCQGHGVGKALVTYIKNAAREHNCFSIELGVWYDNYDAVDFYAAAGFTPRIYKLECII